MGLWDGMLDVTWWCDNQLLSYQLSAIGCQP
jgi:hypothetical protein